MGLGSPEVHFSLYLCFMSSCPFLAPHGRLSAGVSTSNLRDGFLVIHVSPGANKHKVTDGHLSLLRAQHGAEMLGGRRGNRSIGELSFHRSH